MLIPDLIGDPGDFCARQVDRVMQGTVGMYGDFQGIAGKILQEIEGLELRALDAPVVEDEESIGQ